MKISKIYQLNTIFDFGKHKGKTLNEVYLSEGFNYLAWCVLKREKFYLDWDDFRKNYPNENFENADYFILNAVSVLNKQKSQFIKGIIKVEQITNEVSKKLEEEMKQRVQRFRKLEEENNLYEDENGI